MAKLPEVGGVLGGGRVEVQDGVIDGECGECGEDGVIDGVGVVEDYPDGTFLYFFKATELGDCETWRPGRRGI